MTKTCDRYVIYHISSQHSSNLCSVPWHTCDAKAPFHPNFITACVSKMLRSNLSVFLRFIFRNHSSCISRCRCHTLHLGVIWDEIGASRTDLFCTTRSLPHGPANQYHKTVESQGFLWLPWKNPKSDSVTTVPLAKNDWN